jgi:HEAT repeat protein
MSEQRKNTFAICVKFILILLPAALAAAGVNTYIATRVALTPEDSLEMTKEAEDNVLQLEASLDGTPQGWQRLMLTAKKLYELGGLATPALLRLASSKRANPMIRKMAIEIVRDLKDPRAIEPFTRIARDTSDAPGVRYNALYSLGDIGTDKAIDSLLIFLQSSESLLKEGALSGIRGLPRNRDIGRAFAPTVEIALNAKERGPRGKAILALSAFGDRAVPVLSDLLQSRDDRIRDKAIHGLSGSGCTSAVAPLAELLSTEDQDLRTSIIFALEDLGDRAAVPALVEMLDRGGYDASNAACALATIGDREALEPLKETIERSRAKGVEPDYHVLNAYKRLMNESSPRQEQ